MSGSTIGGVVGGVIGFWIGGPYGAQIGWMIGAGIGAYVDPVRVEGPRLKDASAQTSRDGVPIPFGYGTFPVAGNIIWQGPLVETKKTERQGKGGGTKTTTYTYNRSYAIGVCEGEANLLQLKRNGKIVFDARNPDALEDEFTRSGLTGDDLTHAVREAGVANAKLMASLTWYSGSESQLPDSTIEAVEGAGNVPAYRGLTYFVMSDEDLTQEAGAIPQWEIVVGTALSATSTPGGNYIWADGGSDATTAMQPFVDASSPYAGYAGTAESHWDASVGNPAPGLVGSGYMRARIPNHKIIRFDVKPGYLSGVYYGHTLTFLSSGTGSPFGGGPSLRLSRSGGGWQYGYRTTLPELPDTFVSQGSMDTPTDDGWHTIEVRIRSGNIVDVYVDDTIEVAGWDVSGSANGDWIWWDKELAYSVYTYFDNIYASDGACYLTADPNWTELPDSTDSYVGREGGLYSLCSSVITTYDDSGVALSTIVTDLCSRVGIGSTSIDVSELTDIVKGYRVANETTADQMIAPLAAAYFFDVGEWDKKLRFVKRGAASTDTIAVDELAYREPEAVGLTRSQEAELLRKVTIGYIDPDAGYSPTASKPWERRAATVQAQGESIVELPLVLSADSAAQIAAKRGQSAWAEPLKIKFNLPYKWAKLTAPSTVTVQDGGGTSYVTRIMSIEEDGGVLMIEGGVTNASAYESDATGELPKPPPIYTKPLIGPTIAEIMDLPIWTGQPDDELGVYIVARGALSAWTGAEIQVSEDAGATWATAITIGRPGRLGHLQAALSGAETTTMTVYLPSAPASATALEVSQQDFNRAAVLLDSGVWEILQFQDVTDNGNGSYTLTTLTRSRYATVAGAAAINRPFVLLDEFVEFLRIDKRILAFTGGSPATTLTWRAVSLGTDADNAATETIVIDGVSQTEWPVLNLSQTRLGNDDLDISWEGQMRFETAHSKYFDGFRVFITDGSTTVTYVLDEEAFLYTTDRQLVDFGSIPVSLTATVEGVNKITNPRTASDIELVVLDGGSF